MAGLIISTVHTKFTSLGTSTTKTLLGGANVILPSWVKSILAVKPQVTIGVPTATEPVICSCELESNDIPMMPYQVLPAPIGPLLGATNSPFVARHEEYLCGTPTAGGEQISVYETALLANTSTPLGGATLIVSNQPAPFARKHAKIGTITASGTTASTDVGGTKYNFSGANRLVELMGVMAGNTVAAADDIPGYFKFTSNEFNGVADVILPINPISGGLSTLIDQKIDGTSRQKVSIPVFPGQVNIQDYLYMGAAPNGAGDFITGVMYE